MLFIMMLWHFVMKGFSRIDGEKFIVALPSVVAWLSASVLACVFLWLQSVELYENAGFQDSFMASIGGMLMVIGFAAYHSITKSKIAFLLCLYAGGYECYLMISGTIKNKNSRSIEAIEENKEIQFLVASLEKVMNKYQNLKSRFEDPASKVYQNGWFEKNHIDPVWDQVQKANQSLKEKKDSLSVGSSNNQGV